MNEACNGEELDEVLKGQKIKVRFLLLCTWRMFTICQLLVIGKCSSCGPWSSVDLKSSGRSIDGLWSSMFIIINNRVTLTLSLQLSNSLSSHPKVHAICFKISRNSVLVELWLDLHCIYFDQLTVQVAVSLATTKILAMDLYQLLWRCISDHCLENNRIKHSFFLILFK